MYGAGKKPSTEPMLMMRPAPWRRMCGTTAPVIRTIPKKFVSKIARACSIELSSAPAGAMLNPALLTRRSSPPSDRSGRFIAGHVEREHLECALARGRAAPTRAIALVAGRGEPLRGGLPD